MAFATSWNRRGERHPEQRRHACRRRIACPALPSGPSLRNATSLAVSPSTSPGSNAMTCTGVRGAHLLLDILEGRCRPAMAMAKVPVLTGARSLRARAARSWRDSAARRMPSSTVRSTPRSAPRCEKSGASSATEGPTRTARSLPYRRRGRGANPGVQAGGGCATPLDTVPTS